MYDGIGNTLLEFDNLAGVRIESEQQPSKPQTQQVVDNPVQTTIVESAETNPITQLDIDNQDWVLDKSVDELSTREKRIHRE